MSYSDDIVPYSDGDGDLWDVEEIVGEHKTKGLLIKWKGVDPDTNKPWPDSYTDWKAVTEDSQQEWIEWKKANNVPLDRSKWPRGGIKKKTWSFHKAKLPKPKSKLASSSTASTVDSKRKRKAAPRHRKTKGVSRHISPLQSPSLETDRTPSPLERAQPSEPYIELRPTSLPSPPLSPEPSHSIPASLTNKEVKFRFLEFLRQHGGQYNRRQMLETFEGYYDVDDHFVRRNRKKQLKAVFESIGDVSSDGEIVFLKPEFLVTGNEQEPSHLDTATHSDGAHPSPPQVLTEPRESPPISSSFPAQERPYSEGSRHPPSPKDLGEPLETIVVPSSLPSQEVDRDFNEESVLEDGEVIEIDRVASPESPHPTFQSATVEELCSPSPPPHQHFKDDVAGELRVSKYDSDLVPPGRLEDGEPPESREEGEMSDSGPSEQDVAMGNSLFHVPPVTPEPDAPPYSSTPTPISDEPEPLATSLFLDGVQTPASSSRASTPFGDRDNLLSDNLDHTKLASPSPIERTKPMHSVPYMSPGVFQRIGRSQDVGDMDDEIEDFSPIKPSKPADLFEEFNPDYQDEGGAEMNLQFGHPDFLEGQRNPRISGKPEDSASDSSMKGEPMEFGIPIFENQPPTLPPSFPAPPGQPLQPTGSLTPAFTSPSFSQPTPDAIQIILDSLKKARAAQFDLMAQIELFKSQTANRTQHAAELGVERSNLESAISQTLVRRDEELTAVRNEYPERLQKMEEERDSWNMQLSTAKRLKLFAHEHEINRKAILVEEMRSKVGVLEEEIREERGQVHLLKARLDRFSERGNVALTLEDPKRERDSLLRLDVQMQ